jgi:phage terminase Nu1 subunit (DNA packaging protein)
MAKNAHKVLEDEDVSVYAPTLARVCRLHVSTILKLAEEGIVVRIARGRYAQWASIGNLIEHYREQAAGRIGRDENIDAVHANCELKNSQRRLNELRIAKMEGELISLPDVKAAWLVIVPARARFDLPHLTGEDQKALDRLAREMLTEVATEGRVRHSRSLRSGCQWRHLSQRKARQNLAPQLISICHAIRGKNH